MKKTGKTLVLIALVALIATSTGLLAGPGWATSSDPLVSKSWVDQYVKAQFDPLDQQVVSLQSAVKKLRSANTRHVELWLNQTLALVNSKEQTLDVLPQVQKNYIMLPMRFVGEALGITINWNNQTKTVVCSANGITVVLPVGSSTASVNGRQVSLDCAPLVTNGRIMVPTRFIAQSFGATVNWNNTQKKVDIYK